MPQDIGPGQVDEALKLHGDKSWVWLFEVHVGTDQVVYLTSFDREIVFDGNTYQPYPLTEPTVPESGTTNAITASITVFNSDDTLTNWLRDDLLLGNSIFIRVVHEDHLDETDIIAHEAIIRGAEAVYDDKAVRFTIGIRNWLNKIVGRRFVRLRCQHVYGGAACGYDTSRPGALASCSHLREGANGCEEHGIEEGAKGFLVLHPERFGGFEGIPAVNVG